MFLTKSCHNRTFYIIAELRDCEPSDFFLGKETLGQVEDHLCPKDCTSTNYLESLAISEVVPDAIEKNQDGYEDEGRYKMVPRYLNFVMHIFKFKKHSVEISGFYLPMIIYMKSNLGILEVQKLPFLAF